MFTRRLRDIVRGLLGTYVIEQRLIELRDAIRDHAKLGDVGRRIRDLESGLKELTERILPESRLGDVETRLNSLIALSTHAVVRDVAIVLHMGFLRWTPIKRQPEPLVKV
jgi:hypothetical protein